MIGNSQERRSPSKTFKYIYLKKTGKVKFLVLKVITLIRYSMSKGSHGELAEVTVE